jgi:hypothetical protein
VTTLPRKENATAGNLAQSKKRHRAEAQWRCGKGCRFTQNPWAIGSGRASRHSQPQHFRPTSNSRPALFPIKRQLAERSRTAAAGSVFGGELNCQGFCVCFGSLHLNKKILHPEGDNLSPWLSRHGYLNAGCSLSVH